MFSRNYGWLFLFVALLTGCSSSQPSLRAIKKFLPELDATLDYAEQIQHDSKTIEDVRAIDHLSEATEMTEDIKGNILLTLNSDFSFSLGKYELSGEGKAELDRLIEKIIQTKEEYLLQYPDKNVTIKIKVISYTDEASFRKGTALVEELIEGFEQNAPQDGIERRKFLNQHLSILRAKTIGEYVQQRILEAEERDSDVSIEQEIIGKGEEIPPGINPPYPARDPRRRICKIYSYVIAR